MRRSAAPSSQQSHKTLFEMCDVCDLAAQQFAAADPANSAISDDRVLAGPLSSKPLGCRVTKAESLFRNDNNRISFEY